MKEIVKNASGKPIGQIWEAGNRIYAQDTAGKTLGWYDKNTDKTFDKSGSPVYSGNMVRALLVD
jgi:hypothetical protein